MAYTRQRRTHVRGLRTGLGDVFTGGRYFRCGSDPHVYRASDGSWVKSGADLLAEGGTLAEVVSVPCTGGVPLSAPATPVTGASVLTSQWISGLPNWMLIVGAGGLVMFSGMLGGHK